MVWIVESRYPKQEWSPDCTAWTTRAQVRSYLAHVRSEMPEVKFRVARYARVVAVRGKK